MALAYDVTSAAQNGLNASGSSVAGTAVSITAAAGEDIFFAIQFTSTTTGVPSTVQCDGVTMTAVDNQRVAAIANAGATYVYRAAGAGTGSASSITYNVPGTAYWVTAACSVSGVGNMGAAIKASGNSSSLSSGAITLGTNQVALCFYGSGNSGATTVTAHGGGTNHINATSGSGICNLLISSATATDTFTATLSGAQPWSSVAIVLSPTPITVSPVGASTTATGGVPVVTETNPGFLQPGGATVTATTGTPVVTGPAILPGGPTLHATSGTPTVSTGFSVVLDKLAAAQAVRILCAGDSITYGVGDNFSPNFLYGWVGRMGIALGMAYKANVGNVKVVQWDDGGQTPSGYPNFGTTGQFYDAPVTLYTGSGSADITMVSASCSGQELNYLNNGTRLPLMFASPTPDVIFLCTLINDYGVDGDSTSTYVTKYQSWLTNIQALYPNTPIFVTNENPGNNSSDSNYAALGSALFTGLAGWPNVTLIDTRAMYTDLVNMVDPNSYLSGVHPQPLGYATQAKGMLAILAPSLTANLVAPGTISPTGASTHATLGTPLVTEALTISPTGASTTATPGTPVVTSPELIAPSGATTTATPGAPAVTAPDTVAPTGASTAATGGIPVVTEAIPFSGPVTISPGGPTMHATPAAPVINLTVKADWGNADLIGNVSFCAVPVFGPQKVIAAQIVAGQLQQLDGTPGLALSPPAVGIEYYLFTFTSCTIGGVPVTIAPVGYCALIQGQIDLIASTGTQLTPVPVG